MTAIMSSPVQSSPVQSSPVQSSPVQSSPVQSSPLLSVIVPTYNRKEMLKDALNGILSQSLKGIEVIVVDDCSSDETQDYMNSLNDGRITYIRREKNTGVHYNYSLGLSEARGKYVVFHDDDDYYTDNEFLAKAVKILNEHENDTPQIVCACSQTQTLTVETGETELHALGYTGRVKGIDFILGLAKKYRKASSLFPTVFRADVLKNAGLHKMFMDDSETYWHAMLYGDAWYMPDVIGVHRKHAESYTQGRKKDPESDERRYNIVRERTKQHGIVYRKLCGIVGEKAAKKFYANTVYEIIDFYSAQGRGFADTFRLYKNVLAVSDFMPELRYILPMMRVARLYRRILRNIKPIHKIYLRIKYRKKS